MARELFLHLTYYAREYEDEDAIGLNPESHIHGHKKCIEFLYRSTAKTPIH